MVLYILDNVLEAKATELINLAGSGRISKKANIVSTYVAYDKNKSILTYRSVDRNGSGRSHIVRLLVPKLFFNLLGKAKTKEQIIKSLLNNDGVRISCSCESFKYYFSYLATKNSYNMPDYIEKRFPKITNPMLKGSVCKHVAHVLYNLSSITPSSLIASLSDKQ